MCNYLREILQLLGDERRKLPAMVLLFILVALLEVVGLGLIGPYIALLIKPEGSNGTFGWIIHGLGLPRDPEWLITWFGISLVVLYLIKAVVSVLVKYITTSFSMNQQVRIRTRLMKTYQSLPYTEYLQRNSAEYIFAIQQLSGNFSNQVVMTLLQTIADGFMGLAILAMLAWTNGLMLLILSTLLAVIVFGYDRLFRRHLRTYGLKANQSEIAMVKGIHEGVEGLKEVRILGCDAYFFKKLLAGAEQYARFQTLRQVISLTPRYLLEFLMVSFIVFLTLGMIKIGKNVTDLLPTLGVFIFAAMKLLPTVNVFTNSLLHLRFNRDVVSRLYFDLVKNGRNASRSRCSIMGNRNGYFNVLTMSSISFRYPNTNRDALSNITLDIHAGESIGIIGTSGSGKSTLVDVILGLLEPYEGEIKINGELMSEGLDAWRAQVAYLPQQIFLTDDTIRRNVALGIEDVYIDDNRISEALLQARLFDLVNELPEGVETILGEHGVRLSGGQRQRIALARAFYHGRSVLVMDEATSALDNETESEITKEISRLKGKKTLIVIAHRISTVQKCDRIYRLEEGRIVKFGRPEDVL